MSDASSPGPRWRLHVVSMTAGRGRQRGAYSNQNKHKERHSFFWQQLKCEIKLSIIILRSITGTSNRTLTGNDEVQKASDSSKTRIYQRRRQIFFPQYRKGILSRLQFNVKFTRKSFIWILISLILVYFKLCISKLAIYFGMICIVFD